jgi:hypothetical protein
VIAGIDGLRDRAVHPGERTRDARTPRGALLASDALEAPVLVAFAGEPVRQILLVSLEDAYAERARLRDQLVGNRRLFRADQEQRRVEADLGERRNRHALLPIAGARGDDRDPGRPARGYELEGLRVDGHYSTSIFSTGPNSTRPDAEPPPRPGTGPPGRAQTPNGARQVPRTIDAERNILRTPRGNCGRRA